ncbi:MAG TPA: ATP-dependent helicase, partial [Acidobacteriota bacterium]
PAREAARTISNYESTPLPGAFTPFAAALANSLTEALDEAEELDATGPLTTWKDDWTKKHHDGMRHLADVIDVEKFDAIADMYEAYIARMHTEGYYDYNDMILDTIAMLENNLGVRLDLQERYHYILVDEFQDTNDAQMRLLRLLTDNAVHEGRPNIMVVGDDDQAIYKFQGAEISNILDFRKTYREPSLVVLKHNYRSTQAILDVARHVIKKGSARLENISAEMQKELIAANTELKEGAILHKEFPSRDTQYHWLAQEVKKVLEKGTPAKEIAIIARKHSDLEALVPYFHSAHVPVAYERQQNVLREPHILQLIAMARYVDSVMKKNADADELLPEILSFPFWNISRQTVWELSVTAYKERKPWLAVMRESGGQLTAIADFFTDLGARATYQTAEEILHELLGGAEQIMPDEDNDETVPVRHDMFSPFRSYYFGKNSFEKQRVQYLQFLSSLQSFVGALREYRRGKPVMVRDMLAFVDMHEKNNAQINNTSPFVNDANAIQLMSAHKAKGLEFETVFVINCQEDVWADAGRGRNVPLPANLPISPAGDTLDDQLRLFYVAITRAKRMLYLTSYHLDQRGKESSKLGFLAPAEGAPQLFSSEFVTIENMGATPEDILITQWSSRHAGPFVPDEKALLTPLLETYQLSVTHVQNFLNIADGGPLAFFEKNLLRFPEPKTASSALGSAMHNTIQRIYKHL